jgi:hypothetical protein
MQLFFIYLFLVCSTCFGRFLRPSSGAHNCSYSFGYCQTILLLADIMDEMERSSISSMMPAILVDNTRSCKYSYVLLMMGEGIARNMYSRPEINKSRIVASCWLSFIIILVMHDHMDIKLHWILVNTLYTLCFCSCKMSGLDLGTFCLDNTSQMPLNLAAKEVETLSATKRLHCWGAIEPI